MGAVGSIQNGLNTLRPRQNGRHFADDILKWIFLNENVWIPIEISLKFVPKGPIENIPALVWIMAWRRPGDKPLSEPIMVTLPTHICVVRPQWFKVVFCYKHFTPSHYHYYAYLLTCFEYIRWKIIEACVNDCWVHSVKGVFKILSILSITLLIFFAICEVVCDRLVHSSLGGRGDRFITHLIIITILEVSIFPIVVTFFPWMCACDGCTIICCRFHICV